MKNQNVIDPFSFQIGMINCFVEMVACGVKPLAISPPLTPVDYEIVKPYSDKIVTGFSMKSFLEKSLLNTALQTEAFTQDKWVILYYKNDDILDAYFALKEKQVELKQANQFDDDAGRRMSIEFMTLLGYPMGVIEDKLSGKHPDPFMLIDH